jgi:hypothetical protein
LYVHILNTIPTRNSVINADESFLVHHFQRSERFTILWGCFEQCVKLWAVRGHTEDVQTYVKLKKSVLGWRHLQENHWLGLLSKEGWLHREHDKQLN